MDERAGTKPGFDRLTPESAHEVRRNLTYLMAVVVAVITVLSAGIAVAVDPGLSGVGKRLGVIMFAVFLAYLIPVAATLLALAYLFDCWPALLRRRFLQTVWGVEPAELSAQAWHRRMRSRGFWLAFLRGAVVGWAFASIGHLAAWTMWEKSPARIAPSAVVALVSGQLAAYAWVVRQVVTTHQPGAPAERRDA